MQTAGRGCVATNAFGRGSNKPDIVRDPLQPAGDAEAYYRRRGGPCGRAASKCVLALSVHGRKIQEFFIARMASRARVARKRRGDDPREDGELKEHAG